MRRVVFIGLFLVIYGGMLVDLYGLTHRHTDIPLPEDADRALHVGCSLHTVDGLWENEAWIEFHDHKWTFLLSKRPQEDDERSLRDCADFLHAWKEQRKHRKAVKK